MVRVYLPDMTPRQFNDCRALAMAICGRAVSNGFDEQGVFFELPTDNEAAIFAEVLLLVKTLPEAPNE